MNFNQTKYLFSILLILLLPLANGILSDSISFSYAEISGIGKDSLFNRRDNSDIIKVGNKYYVWYTRMASPVTPGYWGTIWHATSEDEGSFDSHAVFTPNILTYKGKYYLYYTGVEPTPGNPDNEFENNSETDFTAIGLAVADSPEGPFEKHGDPLLDKSHEVLIWSQDGGVASLASINKSIYFAADGVEFQLLHSNLSSIPKAPGLYHPEIENGNANETMI